MKYSEQYIQSPNYSRNQIIRPAGVVFHHSAGFYAGTVAWCTDPKSQVSYHCAIAENGARTVMAGDAQRAWHAGKSSFKGRSDCNSFMLGCAFMGDTVTGNRRQTRELTMAECESALEWLLPRYKKWGMTFDMLTDHRTVSPGRKNDLAPDQLEVLLAYLKKHLPEAG